MTTQKLVSTTYLDHLLARRKATPRLLWLRAIVAAHNAKTSS